MGVGHLQRFLLAGSQVPPTRTCSFSRHLSASAVAVLQDEPTLQYLDISAPITINSANMKIAINR